MVSEDHIWKFWPKYIRFENRIKTELIGNQDELSLNELRFIVINSKSKVLLRRGHFVLT